MYNFLKHYFVLFIASLPSFHSINWHYWFIIINIFPILVSFLSIGGVPKMKYSFITWYDNAQP